jgi:hypothetical protein
MSGEGKRCLFTENALAPRKRPESPLRLSRARKRSMSWQQNRECIPAKSRNGRSRPWKKSAPVSLEGGDGEREAMKP